MSRSQQRNNCAEHDDGERQRQPISFELAHLPARRHGDYYGSWQANAGTAAEDRNLRREQAKYFSNDPGPDCEIGAAQTENQRSDRNRNHRANRSGDQDGNDRVYAQQDGEREPSAANPLYRALRAVIPPRWSGGGNDRTDDARNETNESADTDWPPKHSVDPTRTLTYCFLRLANLDNGAFKRLNRYEAALWRQTVQTMVALRAIRYR